MKKISLINYQTLLITYLELTIRNTNHAWKEKKSNQDVNLFVLNNRLNYRCKECRTKCTKLINEVNKNFPITYQFYNGDLNKFVLLLRKGVYPYEYMDSWERFNETSLPNKKAFYSELNLEDITMPMIKKYGKYFK